MGRTTVERVVVGTARVGLTGLSWLLRAIGTVFLVFVTTMLFLALIFAIYVKYDLEPNLGLDLQSVDLAQSSQIYTIDKATGEEIPLQTIYSTENRVWVDYDQLPKNLVNAAIAIEDQRFEKHQGVDWYRTVGAFVTVFSGGDTFGGSTITQQLIKNITKDNDVTVQRKLTEIFRAFEFERKYTKRTIMEWYLNTIYFGERSDGAETAALAYFGKDVWDLSLAECASLISITNNPSLYDPYISEKTLENNKHRQTLVLQAMLDQEKITKEQYDRAVNQELVFKHAEKKEEENEVYSWFVDQVIYDVRDALAEKYDISTDSAKLLLSTGGYKIYATIDPEIQAIADDVYSNLDNLPGYYSIYNQQLQSAISIIEPSTGSVVAMVGGVGEKTQSLLWNRATMSLRSPGSSIKPITVYGPAIEEGLITPSSVYDDAPVKFGEEYGPTKVYPKNQNNSYRGLTTIKYAVQASLNTVAVGVVDQMTPEVSFKYGTEKFGLTSLVESRLASDGRVLSDIGLSAMALGGLTDGVSVEELTAAYATYANDGYYNAPRTYTKVTDQNGNVILDNTPKPVEAVSERTVFYMNDLLTNVVKQGTGTRAQLNNMTVAGKTGTTSDDNDRWFVGYTPYYAAAVWVGYDTPEEINVNSSTNPALAMWRLVMERVHANLPYAEFETNVETEQAAVCLDSGMLASSSCKCDVRGSRVNYATFVKGDAPKQYCDRHVSVQVCSESHKAPNEFCPEVVTATRVHFVRNFPVSVYVADQGYMTSGDLRVCDIHNAETAAGGEDPDDPNEGDNPGGEGGDTPGGDEQPPEDGGDMWTIE